MKISIIGVGKVGSTLAYTLLQREQFNQLVLVGRDKERIEGEALDLTHVQSFTGNVAQVQAGEIEDTAASDIVVITASAPMSKEVSSRIELGRENISIFKELIPKLVAQSPNAMYVIVSNPVDIMTYCALKFGKLKPSQVLGTGTLIDSARFRLLHSKEVNIHPLDLRTYILGEHGDSQFPFFSKAFAGGEALEVTDKHLKMFEATKNMGYEIVRKKGHTNFAVSAATSYIIGSIIRDAKHTIPVSLLVDGFLGVSDICLSLPAVVGRKGLNRVLKPEFTKEEKQAFLASAKTIRQELDSLVG